MSTTVVLFEDVDPFDDLNFPITFRAHIDYESVRRWTGDTYEAQGAQGGWVKIPRGHVLWPIFDRYVVSGAGFEAIEGQIAEEIKGDREFDWPCPDHAYPQAAE